MLGELCSGLQRVFKLRRRLLGLRRGRGDHRRRGDGFVRLPQLQRGRRDPVDLRGIDAFDDIVAK
jgi:hypothetical protein